MAVKKYPKIYYHLASNVLSGLFVSRFDFLLLFIGKLARLALQIIWINALFDHTPQLAGYGRGQALLFLTTFFLIDTAAQTIFFRGLWFVQTWVENGTFDQILTYPVSSIFLSALRLTDWNDLLSLIPGIILLKYTISLLPPVTTPNLLGYLILLLAGLTILFALYLAIAATTFRVTKVTNLFHLQRDLMTITRFPPEVYSPFLKNLLTFIFPVFVIVAFPTKILLNLLNPTAAIAAIIFAAIALILARTYWYQSLRHYTSAGG